MLRFLYCVLLIFVLISCEKEIFIPVSKQPTKLVCNSLFTKDSVTLYLTETSPIYEKLDHKILQNAKVTLKSDDNVIDSMLLVNLYYISKSGLIAGTPYQIEAIVQGFDKLSAEDYLPSLVKIDSLNFYPRLGKDEEGYEYSALDICFTDPQQVRNYYEISLIYLFVDPFSGNKIYGNKNIFSEDIIIKNEGDNDFDYSNILFSDEMINGTAYRLKCRLYYYEYEPQYFLHFRSISENYYKYKKSLMRHLANQEGDVWSGTGNPVDLYSNIQGGYGIFAGYQEDVDTIYVNK